MRSFVPLVAAVAATVATTAVRAAGAAGPGVFFVLGGQTRPHMAVSGPTHMVKTVHHVLLMDNGGHPMKPILPPASDTKNAASTPRAVVVAPPPHRRATAGLSGSSSAPPAVRVPHLYHYQLPRYGRVPGYNFQPQFQQLPTYLSPTYSQPGGGANSYDMQGLKDLAARFLDPVDFKAISARQEMIDRHKEMLERQREMARQQEMLQRQIEAAEIQQDFDKMDQMLAQIADQTPASQPQVENAQQTPADQVHEVAEHQGQQKQQQHQQQQQQQEQPGQGVADHHQTHEVHHHQQHQLHQESKQDVQPEEKHVEEQQQQQHQQSAHDHRSAGRAQQQPTAIHEEHQSPIQAIAGHPQRVRSRFHRFHRHQEQLYHHQHQHQQHYPQHYHDESRQYHHRPPQEFHQRQGRHHEQGPEVASSDAEAIWKNQHQHQDLRRMTDGIHVIHNGDAPQHQQHVPAHLDEQANESQKRVSIKEQVAASEVHETILKGKRRLTARLRLKERVPSSASAMFWI